jgi:hypothetical protein
VPATSSDPAASESDAVSAAAGAGSAPIPRRPKGRQRLLIGGVAGLVALVLLGAGGAVALSTDRFARADEPGGQWLVPVDSGPATSQPSASPTPAGPAPVTLSATGDIVLGDAGRLPPDDGAGFFADVVDVLAADLVMGNLEQPLTDDTGFEKCPEDSTACHAFRAPPSYAAHLRDGGFQLMNLANNHGNDFGPQGRENTRAALEAVGIAHTGERDQVTVVAAADVTVAVVGFSPYAWTNDLNDHAQAAAVVARATEAADLVVVQVHMGAEGADATRVSPGPEEYYGENRGDPMTFARAVIDAGADLVVGHGPHVLRGLEFYQGKLIAYSLGNFAGGGGTLNAAGNLGLGAVLRVSLYPDGGFAGGQLVSTHMYEAGLPRLDPQQRGLELVREVTELDFPQTGARLGADGEITPPSPG